MSSEIQTSYRMLGEIMSILDLDNERNHYVHSQENIG